MTTWEVRGERRILVGRRHGRPRRGLRPKHFPHTGLGRGRSPLDLEGL